MIVATLVTSDFRWCPMSSLATRLWLIVFGVRRHSASGRVFDRRCVLCLFRFDVKTCTCMNLSNNCNRMRMAQMVQQGEQCFRVFVATMLNVGVWSFNRINCVRYWFVVSVEPQLRSSRVCCKVAWLNRWERNIYLIYSIHFDLPSPFTNSFQRTASGLVKPKTT